MRTGCGKLIIRSLNASPDMAITPLTPRSSHRLCLGCVVQVVYVHSPRCGTNQFLEGMVSIMNRRTCLTGVMSLYVLLLVLCTPTFMRV